MKTRQEKLREKIRRKSSSGWSRREINHGNVRKTKTIFVSRKEIIYQIKALFWAANQNWFLLQKLPSLFRFIHQLKHARRGSWRHNIRDICLPNLRRSLFLLTRLYVWEILLFCWRFLTDNSITSTWFRAFAKSDNSAANYVRDQIIEHVNYTRKMAWNLFGRNEKYWNPVSWHLTVDTGCRCRWRSQCCLILCLKLYSITQSRLKGKLEKLTCSFVWMANGTQARILLIFLDFIFRSLKLVGSNVF